MKLRTPDSDKMEVLYPGNLALLSMFLKNPETNKGEIKKDEAKKGDGPGECADVLTCGVCQKDFLLADILRFIQHKVQNCQAPTGRCGRKASSGEHDATAPPHARDHNGDLSSEGPSNPASPATIKEEGDDYKADDKRKRDDEDDAPARKKPRSTQDAEANTTDSEPARYVCGTCGAVLGSAWSLVQHVQSSHGIIIYQEAPGCTPISTPSTPPGMPRPSHSSPLASVSSTAPTTSGPHPPPLQLLDPSKVDLSKVDITKVDLSKVDLSKITPPVSSGATPMPPHPPVNAPLLDPNHPFNLLRVPLGDGRAPFPPGLTPPFMRPGHDFRMDQLLQEGLRLNPGLLPPPFERPPFLDPGLGAPRHAAPTPLTSGGDPNLDFYSQRLRQLAGTTSPTSSTSPRKPLPTPPFASPNAPTPSSLAASQTPTSTRTDPALMVHERRFKCMTCCKCFRWESNLAIHQRLHTGEKDFRCSRCQEALPTPQKLRLHMKAHKKSSSTESNSPDSSRPQTEDDNDEEEEEEEEEEDEEIDDDDDNPSICDSGDEEEDDIAEEDMEDDEPEDLSTTSKNTPVPTSQSVSSSTADNHKLTRGDQQKSVVGELMDKFGLTSISAYSEAYHQALKESGRLTHHHIIGKDGEKIHTNGIEKLKLRDDLTKGLMGGQPTLEVAHQTLLGAFDNPYDAQKRLVQAQRDGSLYAGLWLPNLAGTGSPKDLFPGLPTSEASFLQRKLMTEGPMKPGDVPVCLPKPGTSSAPGTPISLVPPPKKEHRRNDTCEFCGKVFKNCSNLTVHRRSHTGEKPYKCDLCSYACAQSSKLTRHMKTHGRMGKDVYRCRFCDMPFSVASTLEKHMRKCVVNQNKKGLFPPLSAGTHEGLDSYKGLHFTPVISDDSSKSGSLFSPHFNAAATANTSNDDTGDSSNLSGPGS